MALCSVALADALPGTSRLANTQRSGEIGGRSRKGSSLADRRAGAKRASTQSSAVSSPTFDRPKRDTSAAGYVPVETRGREAHDTAEDPRERHRPYRRSPRADRRRDRLASPWTRGLVTWSQPHESLKPRPGNPLSSIESESCAPYLVCRN